MCPSQSGEKNKHKNDETTVKCPAEGCDAEVLSRGLHLHVMRSAGDGHGPHMDVPPELDLENTDVVGTQEVTMEYPDERESEQVKRLCPYCRRPFRGKHGVMIHLGQMEGRKNHPENPKERHDPDDFAIVHVDEHDNVIETVEESTTMPSTERRVEGTDAGSLDGDNIKAYIKGLRDKGLEKEAERAEQMLL